jgi:hypothetical protein
MINNIARIGNFTSSEIANLISEGKTKGTFGKPALTYIEEKNMERRLGRALNDIGSAKPLIWGRLLESRAFELLGNEYSLNSKETIVHPEIPFWSGSPDGTKTDTVLDIKCPMTLKSFCQLVDCETVTDLRNNHKDGEKYYWQLVSNAILTGSKFAELVVYMPYQSELNAIREHCEDWDGSPNEVAWIHFSTDDQVPYLIDGGHYKNLNVLRFEVPESDKELLIKKVLLAGKLLK